MLPSIFTVYLTIKNTFIDKTGEFCPIKQPLGTCPKSYEMYEQCLKVSKNLDYRCWLYLILLKIQQTYHKCNII